MLPPELGSLDTELKELLELVNPNATLDDAIELLAQLAQFEKKPPTITEFIEDKEYLGDLITVYPFWKEQLKKIHPNCYGFSPYKEVIASGSTGGGKLQPLTSKVITPVGERLIGDIRPGDVICNPDGGQATVMQIYPQGIKKIYKITFNDGTVIRAGGEHLWFGWWTGRSRKGQRGYLHDEFLDSKCMVLTTDEIIAKKATYDNSPKDREHYFAIPLTKPVTFFNKPTDTIDPYLVGLWLGDGHSSQDKRGNHSSSIGITSMDAEIEQYLAQYDCSKNPKEGTKASTYMFRGTFRRKFMAWLKNTNLFHKHANSKFIPTHLFYASIESRWALLQGLMDTDGYAAKKGSIYYTTISKQLAEDVKYLVESLGGWAKITSKIPTYTYKGENREGQRAYTLYIQLPDKSQAFRLTRKKELLVGANWGPDKGNNGQLFRKMVSIEEDGEEEAVCIRVDHPNHLYLTDHFVVTHNSIGCCLVSILYELCIFLHRIDARKDFNILAGQPIYIVVMNNTKEAAQDTMVTTFINVINNSPFFQKQRAKFTQAKIDMKKLPSRRALALNLPFDIELRFGSMASDLVGKCILNAVVSELNIQTRQGGNQAVNNYLELRTRLYTRFGRPGGLSMPGKIYLDSSKKDSMNMLDVHMEQMKDDPSTMIIDKPLWEYLKHSEKDMYSGETFPVFRGSPQADPFVITTSIEEAGVPESLVIDVPIELKYYFDLDPVRSLQDLGGVSTWGTGTFISSVEAINDAVTHDIVNPVSKDILMLDMMKTEDKILSYVNLSRLVKGATYFVGMDLGRTSDRTGIAFTRIVKKISMQRFDAHTGNDNFLTDYIYQTDLLICIKNKPGQQTPLSKIRAFMIELLNLGYQFGGVTFDQFDSAQLKEELTGAGFKVDYLSVDKKRGPYDLLRQCILERRWKCGFHPILDKELKQLLDKGDKVDHPDATALTNKSEELKPSKDLSDAVASSLWNCSLLTDYSKTGVAMTQYAQAMLNPVIKPVTMQSEVDRAIKEQKRRKKW